MNVNHQRFLQDIRKVLQPSSYIFIHFNVTLMTFFEHHVESIEYDFRQKFNDTKAITMSSFITLPSYF